MDAKCDKWILLKVIELLFAISCFICKIVTDYEASRLFLYLQKLSREWSLLNNVTWGKIGSSVADITYGGYIIITFALLVGRLVGEVPTVKRVTEMLLLGIGAILFIIIGSLVLASLDSVPPELEDNAAILGTMSLVTALLFLIDLGGPRARRTNIQVIPKATSKSVPHHKSMTTGEQLRQTEEFEKQSEKVATERNGFKHAMNGQNGYKKMRKGHPNRFDIYGKDATDGSEPAQGELAVVEKHSPVWSKVRKGQYGKYESVVPSYLFAKSDADLSVPSGPGDPGYVQYAAKRWDQSSQKKRQSPTQV